MVFSEKSIIELVRHKALCEKNKTELDRISTGLLRSNALTVKETELLYKVQDIFKRTLACEGTIDNHLRKFLN